MMNHLETLKLLSQDQFGFCSKQNTEVAATIFVYSQLVKFQNVLSKYECVLCGVPQGSI